MYPGDPDAAQIVTPGAWIRFPESGPLVLATMGRRFLARLIDGLVIGVPATVVFIGLLVGVVVPEPRRWWILLFVVPGAILVAWVYEGLLIGLRGATVGKRAVGVRVVTRRAAALGKAGPGLGVGLARAAVVTLPGLLPCVGWFVTVLVSVSPFFDEMARQGWQDKAVGAYVISTEPVHY